jgi:SAM-dependent MidA family methyltransferase
MSLQARILERIRQEGAIPFAEYMQMALYEPGYGYYVTGPAKMGWEGDYFTSSDVSDFFAHCLGRQLLKLWQEIGEPETFSVMEQGSGLGHLAKSVTSWAEQEQPAFYKAMRYQTADIRFGQDVRVGGDEAVGEKVHVILSNELVDAFPVHIVEKRGERLYEVYVDKKDGSLQEVLGEASSEQVSRYLDDYKIAWQTFGDGWRAEINLVAEQWLEQCVQLLAGSASGRKKQGVLLVIDYGDKARELYSAYHPDGTLNCYYQHQLTKRPLLRPGELDITAHVNFSALIAKGRKLGLRLHSYETQRAWLLGMGIQEELNLARTREFAVIDSDRGSDRGQTALFQWYNLRQSIQTLIDPNGMGNFKVLIMHQ